MKRVYTILLVMLMGNANAQQQAFHQWAATPPMGWNSWDCYGPTVTEAEVKANADYMAKYLKASGWEYIIVDIRWFVSNDKSNGYNQIDPVYNMDGYGRFLPAVNRFPSASESRGFKPLADYIHSKGLKFGIHIMRGIPVKAVGANTPIFKSSYRAADIYSTSNQCTWLRDMYTIDPAKKGAQDYYNSIFQLYADWGVDFVKVDDLSSPIYFEEEVNMIRKAIDATGRKIVLSTSPGETPVAHAAHVQQHANMWRTVGDFWDSWLQLKEHFAVFERWNQYRIKGGWPDGDMLPLGHIGIRAERGVDRMTNFSKDEQRTLMTLWSIFKSPMMFGGDLPGNDAFTNSLLTNKGVLEVLRHSRNNKPLFRNEQAAAWVADDPATGDRYLALFNIADQEIAVPSKAAWKGKILTRKAGEQSEYCMLDITGAKKLFLVVTDGGDNIDWDHGNWIKPMLYNGKDSLSLTQLHWTKASAGWGNATVNRSVSGGELKVNGTTYTNGIGTHSNSVIAFDLPEGYTRFESLTGVDEAAVAQNAGATMQFMVYVQEPAGDPVPAEATVSVDLSNAGIKGTVMITDLWTGKKLGQFSNSFAPVLPQHGAGLYRISTIKQTH